MTTVFVNYSGAMAVIIRWTSLLHEPAMEFLAEKRISTIVVAWSVPQETRPATSLVTCLFYLIGTLVFIAVEIIIIFVINTLMSTAVEIIFILSTLVFIAVEISFVISTLVSTAVEIIFVRSTLMFTAVEIIFILISTLVFIALETILDLVSTLVLIVLEIIFILVNFVDSYLVKIASRNPQR